MKSAFVRFLKAMSTRLYTFCLIVFTLLLVREGAGQNYRSTVYLAEDGLPSSNVRDIAQAADGAMWFATLNGIARYDGIEWTRFLIEDYPLPRNKEMRIVASPDSTIWVAGHNGNEFTVMRWKQGIWAALPLAPEVALIGLSFFGFDVWQAPDGSYKIALGVTKVFEYSSVNDTWKTYPYLQKWEGISSYSTNALCYNANGQLWAGTPVGLLTYQSGWQQVPFAEQLSAVVDSSIQALACSPNDSIPHVLGKKWIAKWNGEYLQALTQFSRINEYVGNSHYHLELTQNGSPIFSKNSPANIVENGSSSPLFFNDVLLTAWCTDIEVDHEDNIWLGSERGAIKLTRYSFRSYSSANGLLEDEVTAVAQLTDGSMMLGGNRGFSLLNLADNKIEQYATTDQFIMKNYRIVRIALPNENTVYIASNEKGLGIWRRGNPILWKQPPDAPLPHIHEVFEHQKQWYAISFNTIYRINPNYSLTKVYEHPHYIRKVETLPNGSTYLMTNHIYSFEGDTALLAFSLSEPRRESIFGMCQWNDTLWVATLNGLQMVNDSNKIVPISIQGYQIQDAIYGLLVDRQNNLWVGGAMGIYHFEGKRMTHYSRSNGLIGNEINRNALWEDVDGKIWIGTDRGVSVYSYADRLTIQKPPLLMLKSIRSNKNEIQLYNNALVELPHQENTLEFGFAGISFIDERRVNYRYRLVGYETDWQTMPFNAHPYVRYTNLPYGEYRFEVQARREDEPWSASVFSPMLRINRSFIDTPWFIVVLALALIGIGYIANVIRVQRRNQVYLHAKVAEKVSEIASSEKQLKQKNEELTALNQELDRFAYSVSHDLKSPLNSIKGLIQLSRLSKSEEEKEQLFTMMESSVEKLRKFIGEIETYTRQKQLVLQFTEIALAEVIQECIELVAYDDGAQSVKITHHTHQVETLISDEAQLRIIINNLLSNAIRYRNRRATQSTVHIAATMQQGILTLSVADNGVGIAPEYLDKIFQMFEKGSSDRSGSSGLGLFIVKETVNKLNGTIEVDSEVGKGSTFTVTIPSKER